MQERDLAMLRNEARSHGDKGKNSSENNSTSRFDYLRNCFKNSQKKEVSSSDSESQNASDTEISEHSAQQKCLDLGKFVIEHFTKEGRELRKREKLEKICKHLTKVDKQKQIFIEELEDILSLGKEDIDKWKQAAENTKKQLEGYKPNLIKRALKEKYQKILQEIISKNLTEEEKQDKWNDYNIMCYGSDKIPEMLNELRQIPEALDKLLSELIPSQQQHLDRIKQGDGLSRYAGQEYLKGMIESVEIQKSTVKDAYLISERYCDQKNNLLDDTSDSTNLSAQIGILYYIKEIDNILIKFSSESQNEITDTKPGHSVEIAHQSRTPRDAHVRVTPPRMKTVVFRRESKKPPIVNPSDSCSNEKHNQDPGPSQPPESQLDLLSKLTEINNLPIYINQLVQQYENLEEVINKLERIEAAHDQYIKILNDEKEKLCKQLSKNGKDTANEAANT
jgi:hypothetical protein